MKSVIKAAAATSYPGRGIVIGKSADGAHAICAYFIMGRSVNSRNRVFVKDRDGLRTKAFDEAKLTDPSLVIYSPVRVYRDMTIVTNGDQTDTVYDFLSKGRSFEEALMTRTFEPDPPNFTPRISGLIRRAGGDFSYSMSILKSDEGDENCPVRAFFHYENPKPGEGRFIHTYAQDGDPLPSFAGEPEKVLLSGGIDEISKALFSALNEENRVSLFVRFIDLGAGTYEDRIINKHG